MFQQLRLVDSSALRAKVPTLPNAGTHLPIAVTEVLKGDTDGRKDIWEPVQVLDDLGRALVRDKAKNGREEGGIEE